MELNEKYRIVYDSENTILQFHEMRIKKPKIDAIQDCGMSFEFTDNSYYPNLKSALIGFLNKCTWDLETAKEVLAELNKLELLINNLK